MWKHLLTFFLLPVIFSLTVSAQDTTKPLTAKETEERSQIAAFADSFIQEYFKTYDLTKVPETFFVSGYKKRNSASLFLDKFDSSLSDDEKFRNYYMWLDTISLAFSLKLKESDFNFEKALDSDDADDITEMFSKNTAGLFKKYPKANLLLEKKNFPEIKTIADFRAAHQDFQIILQEVRGLVLNNTPEQNKKLSAALKSDKAEMFKFLDSFECSGDDCEGFPANTKMHYYQAAFFYLLLVKDKDQYKIVKLLPPTD